MRKERKGKRREKERERERRWNRFARNRANAFLFDIKRRATMPEVAERRERGLDLGLMILWC